MCFSRATASISSRSRCAIPFSISRRSRRANDNCREELRLNRRLAPDVYLGVVPLTFSTGRLVAWRRRRHRRLARRDAATAARRDARSADREDRLSARRSTRSATLADFYRRRNAPRSAPKIMRALPSRAGGEPRHSDATRFRARPWAHARSARPSRRSSPPPRRNWRSACAPGHIVDGHGDLAARAYLPSRTDRHLRLSRVQRELRQVDPFDELAFLGVECALLGATRSARRLSITWRSASLRTAATLVRFMGPGARCCARGCPWRIFSTHRRASRRNGSRWRRAILTLRSGARRRRSDRR